MNILRWLLGLGRYEANQQPAANDPVAPPRCPNPLTSDDGTKDDCKKKRHCHCGDES